MDGSSARRSAARHAGPDCFEDSRSAGTAARLLHCATHPAGLGRSAPSQPGHALSGTVAPGTARMDLLEMGFFGEQPQSQILLVDAVGPETIARGDRELGANDGADDAPTGRRGRGMR